MGKYSKNNYSSTFDGRLKIRNLFEISNRIFMAVNQRSPSFQKIEPSINIRVNEINIDRTTLSNIESEFSLEEELEEFFYSLTLPSNKQNNQDITSIYFSGNWTNHIYASVDGNNLLKVDALLKSLLFEIDQCLSDMNNEIETKPLPVYMTNPVLQTEPSKTEKNRLQKDSKNNHLWAIIGVILMGLTIIVAIVVAIVK